MAGLIPLMLTSSSRTSYVAPSNPTRRRQSAICSSASTSPTTPTHTARPKAPKRLSLPIPVAAIPMLPYTQAEWRKTIAEVKRKYFGKRYRACSARCLEVLEGIKDASQVEPVYLIYLHFYAATSMEICARPLPSNTALRASLLQQARTHFDKASTLINAAEESVLKKFRPGSVGSSRGSSCHSPSSSISSSRAWTPDTGVSSPTDSICSFDDASAKPPKRVKKVSFSLPKEASLHIAAEPIIRPDSPTLGFEDGFFFQPTATPTPEQQQNELQGEEQPSPPKYLQEIELPLQQLHLQTIPECETETEPETSPVEEDDSENAYHIARSVDRCCEHLSSLRAQLRRHSTSLEGLLSPTPSPSISAIPTPKQTSTPTPTAPPRGEEARALDRQARIERLRQSGWQRRRFDARRYEELCEAVLAELPS